MRATDLQGRRVVAESGEALGRVEEIRLQDGAVAYLICGRGGYLQRFMSSRRGRRVDWARVRRIETDRIVVAG